ncbi:CHAT domain-containing protein [Calothrix sp. NIES-2098]|uniref:CHAT domain-containing protein n=1 Tax=Calothrix sp. NIES-2098 TaxID=1954171 RepID=UPI000B61B065|nr:hypothetical protein NIES2098_06580 [Calothrix sp. NIES-2098]
MNINQKQRLERQRDSLQDEWNLRNEKLTQLRRALIIEAGAAVKFQLEQQIQAEETELKRLEQELDNIEQTLSTTVEQTSSQPNFAQPPIAPSQEDQNQSRDLSMKPKKILILAANPKQTVRLRLDEELRDIKEGLQRSLNRDNFDLRYDLAVRPRDIRRAILDYRPNIIHFSGHGVGVKGLSFEDETGKEQLVTGEALAGLFGQFSNQVECVLLNACYSEVQANAIVQHINYVIGMNDAIDDKAAIEFVVAFYDALAAYNREYDSGSPVEFAFNIARNAIELAGVSGESIPELKKKPNIIDKTPNLPVVEPPTNKQIPGQTKIFICRRLTQDWQDLADYFEIQPHERAGFKPGREPHSIWEWLEQRNRLGELESALIEIGREDLAQELKKK